MIVVPDQKLLNQQFCSFHLNMLGQSLIYTYVLHSKLMWTSDNMMLHDECHIEKCPDKVLLNILGYIPHKSLISICARVCKKWKTLSQDSRLWSFVSLRPEVSGIYIPSIEFLVQLIRNRYKWLSINHWITASELALDRD